MKFQSMRKKGHIAATSLSLGLVILAGCQTGTPSGPAAERVVGSGTTPAQTQPAEPKAQPDQVADTQEGFDPNASSGIDGLKGVKGMMIQAGTGGTFVSEDGSLKAVIPPGALSGDAELRFAAIDTSKIPNTDKYMAGIHVQADLGDAYLNPDQQIMVTAKADPRFVAGLQQMYKSEFKPELFSLVQDTDGTWMIQMPLKGPASQSPETYDFDSLANRKVGIMVETGFFPILPEKNQPSGYFLQQFQSTSNRIEAYCYYAPPPPPPVVCDAHVSWMSDDPSLNGKNAAGATVRFNSTTWNTPNELVADANGNVRTWIRQGWSVPVYAYTRTPCPGVGPTVTHTAGGAATQLQCPKYSPRMKVKVSSAQPMNGQVTLEFQLDGKSATPVTFPVNQGATSANFEFFLRVPDDNAHTFKLDRAFIADSAAFATAETMQQPAISIKRNCIYNVDVKLESALPK